MASMEGVLFPSRKKRALKRKAPASLAAAKLRKTIQTFKATDELKFYDASVTISPLAASWVQNTTLVGGITRGADADEREGRKITVSSIDLRATWTQGVAAGPSNANNSIRIMLVYDKSANGAAFADTDLLVVDNVNSHKNLTNESRFQVLWDRVIHSGTRSSPAHYDDMTIHIYKKFAKPLVVEYKANAGTVADITTGNIVLMAAVSQAQTGVVTNALAGYARVRFRG